MTDLISIVIPVYNVENYIERCLESVIKQTYKNIEIILVNDGSTDKSGEICRKYAQSDSRIKVIEKENGGLSSARNAGIDAANGKYITFVDSDDFVCKSYVRYLYSMLIEAGADISMCGYLKVEGNTIPDIKLKHKCTCLAGQKALLALLYQRGISSSAWAKMYKLSLWNEIRFPEGMLHEDVAVMYRIFRKVSSVVCISDRLYYYYQRPGSIVNSSFNKRRMDYVKHTKKCMNEMMNVSNKLYKAAVSRHFSACFELLVLIFGQSQYRREIEYLVKEIHRYRGQVLFDWNSRFINKAAALFSAIDVGKTVQLCRKVIHR